MITRAESIRVMHPLFHTGQGGSIPTSALQLWLEEIDFARAKQLNRLWHSRLPRFGTGFIKHQPFLSFAATFGGIIYAVAVWSNPVARNLPQQTWLELRRLAIAPDAPRNTASRMLAVMRRLIRGKRPEVERLVSYQDTAVHRGSIYAADGWERTAVNADGTWDRPGRSRPAAQSEAPKQRWERKP